MIQALPWWRKPAEYLALVRFSHTVFALPFAIASALWASQGLPSWRISLLILVAMITCRNAAMAFNRLMDIRIDALNPRTAKRHLPSGRLGKFEVWLFFAANAGIFVASAWALNPMAFALCLPTLAAACGYSLTKRFTSFSHFYLGFAIAISPAGAWVAVTGHVGWPSVWLAMALGSWITGFDIIYATQDESFDRRQGLHSMVVKLGVTGALRVAALAHCVTLAALAVFSHWGGLGWPFTLTLLLVAVGVVYLHRFRRSASLDALNQDFFLANAAISVVVLLGVIASLYLK
jgi:4-hydroxybenzoate polyprenyltransferase